MRVIPGIIVSLSLVAATSLNAFALPSILDVSTKKPVGYNEFIEKIKPADVVFIGESHDDKKQHGNELDIIRSLKTTDGSIAIGIEMFSTEFQPQLDAWTSGKLSEEQFVDVYLKNWSYDWEFYKDIFLFARDNHVPMIALNVPKPIIAKVVRYGAESLTDAEKKQLPPHVSWNLNDEQKEYLRRITGQVFGNRPVPIKYANFYQAQALRNSVMALTVLQYKQKAPKTKIVTISGTWHAVRNGAPEDLKQNSKLSSKVILPELPELGVENITTAEADYLILK